MKKDMNLEEINKKIDKTELVWNCHSGFNGWHEVGCPHRKWSKEELYEALIRKKKFELSGLAGKKLSKK